jgi:uncharacterized glyoxalase superfamily protein PhnB
MKKTPPGWPRIAISVFYQDPKAAIEWLTKVFGFELRLKVEGDNGAIVHSELEYGEGLVMVGSAGVVDPAREGWQAAHASPKMVGGKNTMSLAIFVDDCDAHCEHARKSGAVIFREPKTDDYGDDMWSDRTYGARDPEGHQWFFMQRLRNPKSS